jgi:hypothetical protein
LEFFEESVFVDVYFIDVITDPIAVQINEITGLGKEKGSDAVRG